MILAIAKNSPFWDFAYFATAHMFCASRGLGLFLSTPFFSNFSSVPASSSITSATQAKSRLVWAVWDEMDVVRRCSLYAYKFHCRRLPSVFQILSSCTQANKRQNYNTRSASNMFYSLPKVRTNYGLFNIRFKAAPKYGTQLVKIQKPSLFQTLRNQ